MRLFLILMAQHTPGPAQPQGPEADLQQIFELAHRLLNMNDGDKDLALDRFSVALDLSKAALRVERATAERARYQGVTWREMAEVAEVPLATMHARLRVTKASKNQSYGGLGHTLGRSLD